MKKFKYDPIAVIVAQPWDFEIGCYDDAEICRKAMTERIGDKVEIPNGFGSAHWLQNEDTGQNWFAVLLRDDADFGTLVHEISHVMDFVHECVGLPMTYQNTELRGYQMAQLVRCAADVYGFNLERVKRDESE